MPIYGMRLAILEPIELYNMEVDCIYLFILFIYFSKPKES